MLEGSQTPRRGIRERKGRTVFLRGELEASLDEPKASQSYYMQYQKRSNMQKNHIPAAYILLGAPESSFIPTDIFHTAVPTARERQPTHAHTGMN
jgi:hypothetical protein